MGKFRHKMGCFFFFVSLFYEKLDLCASVNDEGRALLRFREKVEDDPYGALSNWLESAVDPCSWFGVECSEHGFVVALNLKDLCLKGTLVHELGKLVHMESLVFYNNSFWGTIPREIGELHKLEVLDIGHNNLSGPLPYNLGRISSLKFLVLRSNRFMGSIPPDLHELNIFSELLVDEELSSSNTISGIRNIENATIRRLLQEHSTHRSQQGGHKKNHDVDLASTPSPSLSPSSSPSLSPSSSPSPSPSPMPFSPSNLPMPPSSPTVSILSKSSAPSTGSKSLSAESTPKTHKHHWIIYLSVTTGVLFALALSAVYMLCWREHEVVSVMPWRTGLSGQLKKAFVTGVPSLKRSELQAACEDFSNVVGSLSDCTLYKGTLSSGVEIAVTSSMVTSSKNWSDQSEAQFRKKITLLSKVNHKNFMNLIGYSAEEEPFTRMMVYEYSPNGTLFEHLHVQEAEHLDWRMRLRIIMGIAYCLEHMHQLQPPMIPRSLNSSTISLSEDYAAKISDLDYMSEEKAGSETLDEQMSSEEGVVYKFGIILLEIISGRLPFSKDDGLLVLWASSHLTGKRPLSQMVDLTLKSFSEDDLCALSEVIKSCISPDPMERPTIAELVVQLRHITSLAPDAVTPKLSPLWWAELEIVSMESDSLE